MILIKGLFYLFILFVMKEIDIRKQNFTHNHYNDIIESLINQIIKNNPHVMDTKQSKLKPCNQLIQQLKSQGLYLTDEKRVKLPICLSPPPSITTRIMSLISNQNKSFNENAEKKIWPLQQNLVLITQANTLSSYVFQKRQNDSIDLHQGQKFHFQDIISAVSCPQWVSLSNQKVYYFIVIYEMSNVMSLFSIKRGGNHQITLQDNLKAKGSILTLQFISRRQFLIITSKKEIFQFKIEKSSLKLIRQVEDLKMRNLTSECSNERIILMKLLACPKEEQQSLIAIFYATWNCETGRCELNIKQMFRQLDGNIYLTEPVYQIFSFTSSFDSNVHQKSRSRETNFYQKQHFEDVQIINQGEYFLLKLHHQIFVITKYFHKYVRLDAITQQFSSFKILMIQHHVPLICCIGTDTMELWHVKVQNKKSNCTLMDVINLNPINKLKESHLIKFWVMNYKQKSQTIFAFDRGGRQIGFFGVKRIDKVSKLVHRITNSNKKAEIIKVQELGKKLGVQKKLLYLKLWNENLQNPSNIFLYLLPSHDLPSIHSELQKYMRKKFILTGELIKIHTQIENILIQKLKEELNFHHLKWFLKTNFQKRKLKLFSFDTQITFKEFQNIYNSSIFDLIQNNIDKKLFPEKRVSKILWNEKPIEDPDINVYHILQEFKLAILQNYEQFLLELLGHYRYNTVDVFQHFSDILPKFPFKMDIFLNGSMMNSQLMISNLLLNPNPYEESAMKETNKNKEFKQDGDHSYQKYWFNEVTEQDWMREKSSVDFIFNTLYPHYQTHQIMNLLTQLTESEWNIKKKYVTHCLISTTINTFRQRVAKIQGLKLYLTVCQFVNGVKFQAQQKLDSQSTTKDVLTYLCKQNNELKKIKVTEQSEIYNTSVRNLKNNLNSQAPRILEIMKQKKLLTGEGYETCILYSKMHDLMVTKQIMNRQTKISDLMTASHSTLIASFFIGEKQRNAQLFNDFFCLYKDKNLLYQSLRAYINSASCSRVQLQILVKQLYNIRSQHQEYNNYLAELLIHGFCMRTQLREKREADEIICMFREIEVRLDLALKLQKFICINQQLLGIFELFMCQKLTYQEVLNHPSKMITLMMQNYFTSNLNFPSTESSSSTTSSIIIIQGRQIDLDIIQNTFSILLYLKQKLYVQMSEMQLSLLYGEIMIEWEQFDVLKTVFEKQELRDSGGRITEKEYFQTLIAKVLEGIYTKESIYMDDNTINYIESILDLLQDQTANPLIIRQRTKLQLSKLLQKWGYTIQSVALQLICVKWKEQNREQLIVEIMDNCIQYFDLQALENLYRLLEATRLGTIVRDIRNPESIRLAYKLAEKMAVFSNQHKTGEFINKQEEISKIIHFINKNSKQYAAQLGLMAQTFLRIVMKKYTQDSFILSAEIKSELTQHVKFIENKDQQPQSAFLGVRKQSMNKPDKCFDSSQHSASIGSRIRDKSHYQSKHSHANMSKISSNKKVINANDPINALHFDDSVVLQRILNLFCKTQSETKKSMIYNEITDLKDWHLKARSIVEYFVLNWQNVQVINEMFRNKFTREVWLNNEVKSLSVNKEITFKFEESMKKSQLLANSNKILWSVDIDLDVLWQVTVNVSKQYIHNYLQVLKHRTWEFNDLLSEKFCKVLYYGFFFLLMSLRFPSSLLHLTSIEYEHIPNFFIINELESRAKNKLNDLHKINFESIWMNFYEGFKNLIIKNLQILLPETKIPNDLETKLIQRLINDIKKQKPEMVLNMKILQMIENSIRKYVKQQKPKVLNELKQVYESMMIELSVSQCPLMRKKSSQMRRLTNNEMKISVKDIQELKSRIQQLSSQSVNQEDQGIMKEIAQAFEEVKKVKQINSQESVKEVVLKKLLNKRQINVSEIMSGRTQKEEVVPFESSIVLQNRTVMHQNESSSQIGIKDTSFYRISKYEENDDLFEEEYFQNHEFKFDSLMNQSHDQSEQAADKKLFSDCITIDDILSKSNPPYLHLISPEQIINKLASKDSKFESKFHFAYPIPENMIEKIKEFAKIINGYELYLGKNSQYYIQQNIKKMLAYSYENILQILQQIYFEEDSILVTFSPKQLQNYNMRKSKGLNCVEQKYKKTPMSFILQLLKLLGLSTSLSFQVLLEVLKDHQKKVGEEKAEDPLVRQFQLKQQKKIFPLCDLTSADNGKSFQNEVETIFGRVNLSGIAINDEIPMDNFQNFIRFIQTLIQQISNQFSEKNSQSQQDTSIYQPRMLKNILNFMLVLQIIRTKNFTEQTRKKLQFLLINFSKQFILQTNQLLQSLFSTNSQLQQLFTLTILNRLTGQ